MSELADIFDRVLYIGTDRSMAGGVAAVLRSYRCNINNFKQLSTNSRRGKIAGMVNFARTLAVLPFYRMFSRRDIVHVHGSSYVSFVRKSMVIRWAKVLGFKVVYHIHGGAFKEFVREHGLDNIRYTLDRCDKIICLSPYWYDYYAGELGYSNVHVVNNMIDAPANESGSVRGDKLVCVFLGAINSEKGIYDLLEAIRCDRDYLTPRAKFVIGGVGEDDKLAAMISDYHLEDIVEARGWIGGESKTRLLSQADILVLPSYIEGLPICILEAMSYGMTIVSTTVGAIPEIVTHGQNGLLSLPGDVEALRCNLRRAVDDNELRSKAAMLSKERVRAYMPGSVLDTLRSIYKQLN